LLAVDIAQVLQPVDAAKRTLRGVQAERRPENS
jgi:hypothetical protein